MLRLGKPNSSIIFSNFTAPNKSYKKPIIPSTKAPTPDIDRIIFVIILQTLIILICIPFLLIVQQD